MDDMLVDDLTDLLADDPSAQRPRGVPERAWTLARELAPLVRELRALGRQSCSGTRW